MTRRARAAVGSGVTAFVLSMLVLVFVTNEFPPPSELIWVAPVAGLVGFVAQYFIWSNSDIE